MLSLFAEGNATCRSWRGLVFFNWPSFFWGGDFFFQFEVFSNRNKGPKQGLNSEVLLLKTPLSFRRWSVGAFFCQADEHRSVPWRFGVRCGFVGDVDGRICGPVLEVDCSLFWGLPLLVNQDGNFWKASFLSPKAMPRIWYQRGNVEFHPYLQVNQKALLTMPAQDATAMAATGSSPGLDHAHVDVEREPFAVAVGDTQRIHEMCQYGRQDGDDWNEVLDSRFVHVCTMCDLCVVCAFGPWNWQNQVRETHCLVVGAYFRSYTIEAQLLMYSSVQPSGSLRGHSGIRWGEKRWKLDHADHADIMYYIYSVTCLSYFHN